MGHGLKKRDASLSYDISEDAYWLTVNEKKVLLREYTHVINRMIGLGEPEEMPKKESNFDDGEEEGWVKGVAEPE